MFAEPSAPQFKSTLYSWPSLTLVLLAVQAALSLTLKQGPALVAYCEISYLVLLLLASGVAVRNAVQSKQTIRLFWSFLAAAFAAWALVPFSWFYNVVLQGKIPAFLFDNPPLFLHIVLIIAAVVSRPHLRLPSHRPYRATLNFLLLLFVWVFAYAYLLFPYEYGSQGSAMILRFEGLYFAENLLLLGVLGSLISRSELPWKSIYWHLFGASALYALGSLAANIVWALKDPSGDLTGTSFPAARGLIGMVFTASIAWFVWIGLHGRRLAPNLAQTVQVDTTNTRYSSVVAMLAVLAIPIVGVWELFRTGEPFRTHEIRLLLVMVASVLLAVAVFVQDYLANREFASDVGLANDRLHLAVESGKLVVWEWDIKTGRTSWFGDLQTIFGIHSSVYVGELEDFLRYVHPDEREQVLKTANDAMQARKPYAGEFRIVWPDGTLRYLASTGKADYSPDGQPERMLGVAVDITARKQAEEALRKGEERLRLAIQAGKMYAYEWDVATDAIVRSDQCVDILGDTAPTCLTRKELMDRVHPDDRERVNAALFAQTPQNPACRITYRMCLLDGSVIWVEKSARAVFDSNGKLLRMTGVIADVTARKNAEEARFRHAAIVESSDDAIISKNLNGIITSWNAGAQRIFGYTEAEAVGQSIEILMPLQLRSEETTILQRLRSGDRIEHYETVRIAKDGKTINVSLTISPVRDASGKIVGASKIARDITDRKQADYALRESEERFRLVANTAPVMIWMSGSDKLCTYFNQTWLDFTGRSVKDELGDGWAKGVHAEDLRRCLDTYVEAFDRKKAFRMEYRLRRHDGEYRWIVDTGVPRVNSDGSFAGYIGSAMDVTDRKRAEEALSLVSGRLIEAQEQERTRIARELHDDINQRIAMLAIEVDGLKQHRRISAPEVRNLLNGLGERVSELGMEIQAISHRLHSSKLEYLGVVVAMKAFCAEFAEHQKVKIDFKHNNVPKALPPDISLCLFRILQEAMSNAVKHSGVRQFEAQLNGSSAAMHLTVRDSGVGFDPEAAMDGRGLGLISMRERVSLVKGEISIASRPTGGAEISVRIPLLATSVPPSILNDEYGTSAPLAR